MKRMMTFFALMGVLSAGQSFADTIYLNNGKKVEGQIVDQTDKATKIDIKGIVVTYDAYEIDRAEKSPVQDSSLKQGKSDALSNFPQKMIPVVVPQVIKPSSGSTGQNPSQAVDASLSSKDKKELISELIDASGARDNMNQMFSQIVSQASSQDSEKLRGLFNVDEVIAQLIPIYDRYFSEDELRGLITFYRSAIGRKLLMVTPQIMQDSMETSMVYFQKKMEGITLSKPQEQASVPGKAPDQGAPAQGQ